MKIKNMNILILGLFIAVSSCGKHAMPKKAEEGGGAPKTDAAASTAGDAEKAAAEKAASDRKKTLEAGIVLGKDSPLYSTIMSKNGEVTVAELLPLIGIEKLTKDDFSDQGVFVSVITRAGKDYQLDQLLKNPKGLSTSYLLYASQQKKIEATAPDSALEIGSAKVEMEKGFPKVKDSKGESNVIKLTVGANVTQVKIPTADVERKIQKGQVVTDWELDLTKTPYVEDATIKTKDGTGKVSCAMFNKFDAEASKNLDGLSSILITDAIDWDGNKISFSALDKAKLDLLPKGKKIPLHIVCAGINGSDDTTVTSVIFTQAEGSITIKAAPAAPAAKPATPKQ